MLVRGELAEPEQDLLPGMFANVSVLAGAPREVVTVPRTAVTYSLYGDSVYVVKPAAPKPGEAQARPRAAERHALYGRAPLRAARATRSGDRVAIAQGVEAGRDA